MNYLLLAVLLPLPYAGLAQQVAQDRGLARLDSVVALCTPPPEKPGIFISGSSRLKYSEGYVLRYATFLYRNLYDARRGRSAHRLRPGDEVFPAHQNAPSAHWLLVGRETYLLDSIPLHCDTAVYYIRKSAVQNKAGLPLGRYFWIR